MTTNKPRRDILESPPQRNTDDLLQLRSSSRDPLYSSPLLLPLGTVVQEMLAIAVAVLGWWATGYGVAFGGDNYPETEKNGMVGWDGYFGDHGSADTAKKSFKMAVFVLQVVFFFCRYLAIGTQPTTTSPHLLPTSCPPPPLPRFTLHPPLTCPHGVSRRASDGLLSHRGGHSGWFDHRARNGYIRRVHVAGHFDADLPGVCACLLE
mmetsp:Transcript_37467/g.101534  ORF Transcript_37467/g.101534 Transcript_37467/m.101534 type:complete len:207 (+) Transcript_37467:533-1153(+)